MDFNLQEYYDDLYLESSFPTLNEVYKTDIVTLGKLMEVDENSTLDYPIIDDMDLWEEYTDKNAEMIPWNIVDPNNKRYITMYYIPYKDIAYYENEKALSGDMYKAIDDVLWEIKSYDLTGKQYSQLKEKIIKEANKFIDSIYKKYGTPKWWHPEYFDFN
nr:hypothetical protein [Candidatus Gracilibacteria bacterium]